MSESLGVQHRLDWGRDGQDWPHREASRFVQAGGLRWHVQVFATARQPVAVLIHGTGASSHSWRDVIPLLQPHFTVVVADLPGHGFTSMPAGGPGSPQFSMPGMTQALGALLQTLGMAPALLVGHSAGAAIAVRMCLDGWAKPELVLSLNGAFFPLGGPAGQLFSPVARLMAGAPWVPRLFSWRAADPRVLEQLISGTGSSLDAAGVALYSRLVRNPGHAAGALAMMARWDLSALQRDLHRLATPLALVAGMNDRTIPPSQAQRAHARMAPFVPVSLSLLPGLGHLAHEERPDLVAALALEQLQWARAVKSDPGHQG